MSYNRLPSAPRFSYSRVAGAGVKKPAFVGIPAAVIAGGMQPWQQALYSWAFKKARHDVRPMTRWLDYTRINPN